MAKIKVNQTKCIGCGACVSVCPSAFEMKDGKSFPKKSTGKPCEKEAIGVCPVQAISIS